MQHIKRRDFFLPVNIFAARDAYAEDVNIRRMPFKKPPADAWGYKSGAGGSRPVGARGGKNAGGSS